MENKVIFSKMIVVLFALIHTQFLNAQTVKKNLPSNVVRGFTLVDPVTDEDIRRLHRENEPVIIDKMKVGERLNIRADFGRIPKSVVFTMDGKHVRTENVAPFALFGDFPRGDYHGERIRPGIHTITATIFEKANGKGKQGLQVSISILVIDKPSAITGFSLVTSDDDQIRYELKDGMVIPLEKIKAKGINVVANTHGRVGSVVFDLNLEKGFRTENIAPFALGGDFPAGDFANTPEISQPGVYRLTATPFNMSNGNGLAGNEMSIAFKVVNKQKANARVASNIEIYPNPSHGHLNVYRTDQQPSVSTEMLGLFDKLGVKVWEGQLSNDNKGTYDISHLAPGIYFLKTAGKNNSNVKRLIVK